MLPPGVIRDHATATAVPSAGALEPAATSPSPTTGLYCQRTCELSEPPPLMQLAEASSLRRRGSTYLISSPAKSKTFVMVTLAGSVALASLPSGDAFSPEGIT